MQIGTPREIYENPANLHVAARLGQPAINLVPAEPFPEAACRPHRHGRRPHGASEDFQAVNGGGVGKVIGSSIWATTTTFIRDAGGEVVTLVDPDAGLRSATASTIAFVRPLYFDREGNGSRRRFIEEGIDEIAAERQGDSSPRSPAVIDNAQELTALDRAIGDGDHGLNMKRGFEAVLADLERLAEKPLPEMCKGIGDPGDDHRRCFRAAVRHLFLALATASRGQRLPEARDGSPRGHRRQGARASDIGEKTMLDVLLPVADPGGAQLGGHDLLARLRAAAEAAWSDQAAQATKGRASFLGESIVGHLDPGARSSQLLVHAACGAFEARQHDQPGRNRHRLPFGRGRQRHGRHGPPDGGP